MFTQVAYNFQAELWVTFGIGHHDNSPSLKLYFSFPYAFMSIQVCIYKYSILLVSSYQIMRNDTRTKISNGLCEREKKNIRINHNVHCQTLEISCNESPTHSPPLLYYAAG